MWKVLEKKDYETLAMDFDPKEAEGTYSGQVRGRMQSIEVKAILDAITIEANKDGNINPLNTYLGNHNNCSPRYKKTLDHCYFYELRGSRHQVIAN